MSIERLPASTASLLHATQTLPTFESAVAAITQNALQHHPTHVHITIHPPSLRFTVRDNGRGFPLPDWPLALLPHCTSLPRASGRSLAALASLASVELSCSTRLFSRAKLVRGSILLDERPAPTLPHGVLVDVWELFFALPVRRAVEAARSPVDVLSNTRDAIVALALANPHIALVLQAENGVVLYSSSPPRPLRLSVDTIQAAFGNAYALAWKSVRCSLPAALGSVHGFIARRGSSTSAMCLLSWEGVPLGEQAWMHRALRRVWKAYAARKSARELDVNRFPAYVLNGHGREEVVRSAGVERATPPGKAVESALCAAVHEALAGQGASRGREVAKTVQTILPVVEARKRKATAEARFAEALVCKRVRRPESSVWASREVRGELLRPLSAGRMGFRGAHCGGRVCIRSAGTAGGVEGSFQRHVPGWQNPCFRGRAVASRTAGKESQVGKRGVCAEKGRIGKLRVVGQVDFKFIVVADDAVGEVYAVDQHAASERALFEEMMGRVRQGGVGSAAVSAAVAVRLTYAQRAVMGKYGAELERWGWRVECRGDTHVTVRAAPELRGIGVVDGVEQLTGYLDWLGEGGRVGAVPKPVGEAVASAACHKAVRFGDKLSREQCEAVVQGLGGCEFPFICAHGRPSIVPLAVLEER